MSTRAVRSFIELINLNRALHARIQSIPRDERALDRVIALGERYGYRFTAADLQEVLYAPRELSDRELESAAGGAGGGAPMDLLLRTLSELG
ncbi:MAG TPA: Nif11-like leader peptide family RiPP precursor [Thermoanaerobaculia bacterium]|nr:Nif11-like leader peptide family RiPP precursor [Thermoanaerobaculia bacterium]